MIGVLLLNFGEPESVDLEEVTAYLERIFAANASLELDAAPGADARLRERSRELAERRAPGLVEEYRGIGGSPLRSQAEQQAQALSDELVLRGHDAETFLGMQFTEPSIADAVAAARSAGADRLVGLPVYPLCGRSTTVAALTDLERALQKAGWPVPLEQISGWHPHPTYLQIRKDAIRRCAEEARIDLADPGTRLVFSVHGTPVKYLEEGSRYDRYAEECCDWVARLVGAERHLLGYQNHSNRGIEWTQPEIEDVIRRAPSEGVERVVVDPISFMHEQSETLAELDGELTEIAEAAGLEFYRVPIPHDDPRFSDVLADLVEASLEVDGTGGIELQSCGCKADGSARCLNGARVL